jgi:anti-sigma regulatory factor (Ser/Thr protein kinase)
MTDEITLVVPAQEDFRPIVHLVVGGLAVRLDLTMDALEDLQVALDALLSRRDDEGDVSVRVVIDDAVMRATVGPLPETILEDVETVCDSFELEDRNGEAWAEVTKETATPTRTGG